jgi:hypothetical protein
VTTHGWQYETGYSYWPPLFRHLSQRCTSFVIPSAEKDTGCWMNRCSTASRTASLELNCLPVRIFLNGPNVIVTRGWSRTPQPKWRRVSCVAWAACGHALSWSISTPRVSFPVIQDQLLALLPHVSMFHLNNPYTLLRHSYGQSVLMSYILVTYDWLSCCKV